MLAWRKFCYDEEVISETGAYFEATDKSYYKNGIEKVYDRYNRCKVNFTYGKMFDFGNCHLKVRI